VRPDLIANATAESPVETPSVNRDEMTPLHSKRVAWRVDLGRSLALAHRRPTGRAAPSQSIYTSISRSISAGLRLGADPLGQLRLRQCQTNLIGERIGQVSQAIGQPQEEEHRGVDPERDAGIPVLHPGSLDAGRTCCSGI